MPNDRYGENTMGPGEKESSGTKPVRGLENADGRVNAGKTVGGRGVPDLTFGVPKEVVDPNEGAPRLNGGGTKLSRGPGVGEIV